MALFARPAAELDEEELTVEGAQHLMVAADRFGVDRLRALCERWLVMCLEVRPPALPICCCPQTALGVEGGSAQGERRRQADAAWVDADSLSWRMHRGIAKSALSMRCPPYTPSLAAAIHSGVHAGVGGPAQSLCSARRGVALRGSQCGAKGPAVVQCIGYIIRGRQGTACSWEAAAPWDGMPPLHVLGPQMRIAAAVVAAQALGRSPRQVAVMQTEGWSHLQKAVPCLQGEVRLGSPYPSSAAAT